MKILQNFMDLWGQILFFSTSCSSELGKRPGRWRASPKGHLMVGEWETLEVDGPCTSGPALASCAGIARESLLCFLRSPEKSPAFPTHVLASLSISSCVLHPGELCVPAPLGACPSPWGFPPGLLCWMPHPVFSPTPGRPAVTSAPL